MGQTFAQLGHLLFTAIPTIIVFVALHFYLRAVLYRPLGKVLRRRSELIEGRQQSAQNLLDSAERKLTDYETALRQHRVESYRLIEKRRQLGVAEAQRQLAAAHHQSAQALLEARQSLAAEKENAQGQLQGAAESLATQILNQVLAGKSLRQPGASA